MPDTLTLLSPAKLNLFLHITGRRGDGYHELQTLFQLLDWGDWLSFTPDASGGIIRARCASVPKRISVRIAPGTSPVTICNA